MQIYSVKYGKFGMGSHTVFSLYAHEFMRGLLGEYRVNVEKPCKKRKNGQLLYKFVLVLLAMQ